VRPLVKLLRSANPTKDRQCFRGTDWGQVFTFAIDCQLSCSFPWLSTTPKVIYAVAAGDALSRPTHRQPLADNGTLEKARVVARVQHCGIGERKLAKIVFGDEALLNISNASAMTSAKSGTSKCVKP